MQPPAIENRLERVLILCWCQKYVTDDGKKCLVDREVILLLVSPAMSGNHHLSQAQSAVPGRYFSVCKHFEAVCFQAGAEVVSRYTLWIGSMKGTMEIRGDIVSPVIDEKDIEALHD